MLNRKIKQL